jgi:hypothetical protein
MIFILLFVIGIIPQFINLLFGSSIMLLI